MRIIRDDERIARMRKRSQQASLIGFIMLLSGFVIVFLDVPNLFLFQMLALLGGWLLSQVGIYLAHRYVRSPRPDQVLDDSLKPVARDGRLYHYVLPAPHVLLTPSGPVVFNLKYQSGNIVAQGDKWRQSGIGMRRFFGQEGLGNPTKETETMLRALGSYIRKNAPEIADEDIPISAMIVFTTKDIKKLDVDDSPFPAMHFSKVKGFMKQKGRPEPLPQNIYRALQDAFDGAANGLLDESAAPNV